MALTLVMRAFGSNWLQNSCYGSGPIKPLVQVSHPSPTHFSQYLSDSTNANNPLLLNPVTEVDILRLVAQVKLKKSKGHDELDMCLIKKLIP